MLFLALKKVGMVKITPPQVSDTQYNKNPPSKIFPTPYCYLENHDVCGKYLDFIFPKLREHLPLQFNGLRILYEN